MLALLPAFVGLLLTAPSKRANVQVSARTSVQRSVEDTPPGLGGRVPRRVPSETDEYLEALADAKRASERLEKASRGLDKEALIARPPGARSTVTRSDAGTLLIDVPAAGLMNGGTLFGGAFSLAWFSAVVPATFASGGGATLFMLPFWLAGGLVAKQTLVDPTKATALSIGEFGWELRQCLPGLTISAEDGATEEFAGAAVEVAAYVNGVPTYILRLATSNGQACTLGSGLPVSELDWLAFEVNAHLSAMRERRSLDSS